MRAEVVAFYIFSIEMANLGIGKSTCKEEKNGKCIFKPICSYVDVILMCIVICIDR